MRKRCEKKCGHRYSRLKNKTHFIDFTYLKEYSGEHVTHVGGDAVHEEQIKLKFECDREEEERDSGVDHPGVDSA